MVKILMSGCNGKMGQVISSMAKSEESVKIVAGVDINDNLKNDYPVFTDPFDCDAEIDVIIDFSHPSAFEKLTAFACERKIPLVMATTGLSRSQVEMLDDIAKEIPVFFSANMSLGINLLINLVKKAAKVLEENYDIEIIEKHHNQKIDAPSGTALAIADAINSVLNDKQEYIYDRHARRKKRSPKEIGIHAVRGGTIVGEHQVIFAGKDEIIEINHIAASKDIFATGALRAAKFIVDKQPGLYGMPDMLGED